MKHSDSYTRVYLPPGIGKVKMKERVTFIPISKNLAVTFTNKDIFVWNISNREVVGIFTSKKGLHQSSLGFNALGYVLGYVSSEENMKKYSKSMLGT